MKNAMQLKAIMKKLAKENQISAQLVLQNYMLERFLERVSLSPYRDNYIIKGGFLISSMVGLNSRATMDMDATIKGYPVTQDTVQKMIEKILTVPVDDDITFTFKSIGEIREGDEYTGYRVALTADFPPMAVPLKLDITTGDKITPREIQYDYKLMLEDRHIQVMAYNLATILAEKLETVISRSDQNTRPRDYYDVYAFKEIDNAQMKTDAEKVRFNKKSVENLDFTSSVPQRTQEQDRIIASIRKEMTENDQQMFLTLLTVTYFADTLEDLALETDALKTTAANYNCRFTELYFQQERAFNTAMPYGLRRIESVRTMLTKSLTALVPFNTQEILTPGGICYGRNAVTGNLIIGLRTSLVNGNAMVVATSGGGKSMFVKLEILMLYLRFTKARFYVVDPENEYAPLVQELGGEVVNISVDSATHFNPLDFKYDKATKIPPHVAKAEFVLSLCEQIMGKEHILAGDKSLIDDALENIYKPLMESHYTAPCPTIKDLWMALNNQRDKRSKEIALALRIFATGSMQAFAQPTNVDMSNRLICFNIQSLGEQLKPVAMLSMLEYINTAVMSNERNDPKAATWVYFDEIYLLLRDSLSANFLYTSWKRFRKYNAYATGITQNVQDCLTNDTAYAMLANSEFVVMLRQTKDIDSVVELYGLSEPQRKYLLLAQPGEGIIKMGNSLIPFNNPQPKDTKTYKLLTTKPGEME